VTSTRRRWWLDALRRAAKAEGEATTDEDAGGVEAAVLGANEAAQRAVEGTIEIAPRIGDAAGRQKATLDGASERASAMAAHAEGLTLAAARVGDVFERLSVVALNAGLEGARTAEPQGKALLLISDEIKTQASRGAEIARDLVSVVEEIAAETVLLRRELGAAIAAAEDTGKDTRALVASAAKAKQALAEVERHLRRATGLDPEVSRAIALAAEHARGLASALATLRAATQARPLLLRALRPVLAPLARMLGELDEEPRNARMSAQDGDGGTEP
jgi:hypothetical protein